MSTDATITHGKKRRLAILDAGLQLWRDDPDSVTAANIGKALGMTHAAILYHFENAADMKEAIAAHAVVRCDKVVVPMLITARHAATAGLDAAARSRYLAGC